MYLSFLFATDTRMSRRAGGRTRKRDFVNGPTPIPIPTCFHRHYGHLAPFARANLPPRMPVLGSIAKLQALNDNQLDELCEDVVVLLPLWRAGIPAHVLTADPVAASGQSASVGVSNGAVSGVATPVTANSNLFVTAPNTTSHVTPVTFTSISSQTYALHTTPAASSITVAPVPHSIPGVPPPLHHPGQLPQHQHSQIAVGSGANPNHPDMRPPTEADALALAPHITIWLPNGPRKRNESRVKLARSFMAGFEGMKALVWDVTVELERRWPLGDESF